MRIRAALVSAAVLVAVGCGTALADDGYPDPGMPPIPGAFVFFAIVVLGVGIGTTVYKMNLASRMAEKAGLDPHDAAMTSLLSENGLPASYVMSNLPRRNEPPAAPPARTIEQRLGDLARLRDQSLITPEEYATRRTAILDDV